MMGVLQEVCGGERKRIIEVVSKQKSLAMGICPKVALIQNESLAGQKSLWKCFLRVVTMASVQVVGCRVICEWLSIALPLRGTCPRAQSSYSSYLLFMFYGLIRMTPF